jgi:hypothetical protein
MQWSLKNRRKAIAKFHHRTFVVTQRYTTTWEVRKYRRLIGRVFLDPGFGYQSFTAGRSRTCVAFQAHSLREAINAFEQVA